MVFKTIQRFNTLVIENKRKMKNFLTRLEKKPPKNLDAIAATISEEVWQETNCTSCGNCCKTMTPTFSTKDIKRIAVHFEISTASFKSTYLHKDKSGDWMNVQQPCPFLEKKTNLCSIYTIRPADCAGFPYLNKQKMKHYLHVHHQNLAYCPATYRMVEKLKEQIINN